MPLRLERPVLIGHSIAGEELSSLAARYPLRAGALVYSGCRRRSHGAATARLQRLARYRSRDRHRRIAAVLPPFRRGPKRRWGSVLPESELRQMFAIAPDGSVGRSRGLGWVSEAIDAGVKRPDYARMQIPALSLQSLPPASVSEARASHRLDSWAVAQCQRRQRQWVDRAVLHDSEGHSRSNDDLREGVQGRKERRVDRREPLRFREQSGRRAARAARVHRIPSMTREPRRM